MKKFFQRSEVELDTEHLYSLYEEMYLLNRSIKGIEDSIKNEEKYLKLDSTFSTKFDSDSGLRRDIQLDSKKHSLKLTREKREEVSSKIFKEHEKHLQYLTGVKL